MRNRYSWPTGSVGRSHDSKRLRSLLPKLRKFCCTIAVFSEQRAGVGGVVEGGKDLGYGKLILNFICRSAARGEQRKEKEKQAPG
jgi:hypothetical protein